ncbi:MAG: S8 family serine peptidase [Vicinamibacterales bacterium]
MTRRLDALGAGRLTRAMYPGATGRGIRVAVVDSGVHPGHPHVGAVEAGIAFDADGAPADDVVDRLGHGTAVAAAIREKAPDAAIVPVKVFHRELRATADVLVAAIDWAVAAGVHLINLSLGTTNQAHRLPLGEAVVRAARAGAIVVAAAEQPGAVWLPGSLPLAVGVVLDWTLPREEATVDVALEGAVRRIRVHASGYPRPIPGVPPERNLKGVSFAVANATGLLCLHLSHRAR